MKKLLHSVVASVLVMVGCSVAAFADDATGHARLHQIDQSNIEAQIFFVDNGSTLWVLGVAQGLDPTQNYISLVYGEGSRELSPNLGDEGQAAAV